MTHTNATAFSRSMQPLMDKGDIGAAGAPEWALNFINGIINSSGETDWPMIFHVLKASGGIARH